MVVEPSFWLVTAVMGWSDRPEHVAAWVAICFASILVHELGHAIANRLFGAETWIRLYSFGGLCYADRKLSKWRRIAVSVSGPFAGFCLGGAVLLANHFNPTDNPFGAFCLRQAVWVNLGWGLVNLMPVVPLDGGHVLEELLGPKRARLTRWISIGVAAAAAVAAYLMDMPYAAVLMGWFGLQGFMTEDGSKKRPVQARTPSREEKEGVTRGWAALARDEVPEAIRLGRAALHVAGDAKAAAAARDLLAWAAIAESNASQALEHLRHTPAELTRALTWALAYEAAELWDRALPFARRAVTEEPSDASGTALMRILLAVSQRSEAEALFRDFRWQRPERAEKLLAEAA